jgi:hypothetical protein
MNADLLACMALGNVFIIECEFAEEVIGDNRIVSV